MPTRRILCALVVAAAAPGTARADDVPLVEIDTSQLNQSLEDVVELAAKRPQPLREAAASTSVITAADLEAYGWRSFQEAVASLAGFYSVNTGEFTYFGVRGISQAGDFNSHVQILVDGHTQQELWSNSAYPEGLGLDAAMIDHIEVLRGPASALYGSLGFAAIINIVTRRGTDKEWERLTYDMSADNLQKSDGTGLNFRGVATIGHRFANKLEFGVAANVWTGLGNTYTYPDAVTTGAGGAKTDVLCMAGTRTMPGIPSTCTNGRSIRQTDAGTGTAVYGHLDWKGFTLKASYQWWEKNIPFAPYQSLFNDTANQYTISRGYVDVGYAVGTPSLIQAQARAYYDFAGYSDTLAYSSDGTAAGRYVLRDDAHPWWTGAEVKLLLERQWANRLSLAVTGGGEFTYFHGDDTSGPVVDPGNNTVKISRDLIFGAAYAQVEGAWARRILVTLGLRGDFSDTFPAALSPRAALVALPHETVTLKALYSHGFLRPSWYQAFFNDNMSIVGNTKLQPEQVDNFELVYQQQIVRVLSLTASAFYIRATDLISEVDVCVGAGQTVTPLSVKCAATAQQETQRQNLRSFSSAGAELGLTGKFSKGSRFFFNYSFAFAQDATGAWPFNSPMHMLKAGASIPVWRDHLVLGAEARVLSPRRLSSQTMDQTDWNALVSAHILWRDLPKNFTAMLRAYDVLAQTWYEPSTAESSDPIVRIPHQGPSLQLRLSYAF